jgi:Family of unknown function (DUF6152)
MRNAQTAAWARRYLLASGVAAMLAFGWGTMPAFAHHSNAPFYFTDKKVETQGKITKFVFMNPHAFLHLDGPDESGRIVDWQIELGAPISLRRTGWTPDTLKIGMEIKVVGSPSRAEGSHGMCCVRMTLPDGSPVTPGGRVQEESVPR